MRLILAVAALVLAMPAQAATKWLRADTHNFIIYSSGSREELQKFSENVERFDALLRVRTKTPREDEPNRLTIYMLNQSGDVAKMLGDKSGLIAGIYLPRREGTFAIANREPANSKLDLSGNTVLFHEYAHHFMFRYFTAPYPAWYVEGFAEFVSTATFKHDGEWMLGRPAYHRAYGLMDTRSVPIETLLFEDSSGLSRDAADAYYGRSWLLVHMLMMDKARAGQLDAYLRALIAGKTNREAAQSVFGDLRELNKELDRYLGRNRIFAFSSTNKVAVDGPIAIVELDPISSQLVELGLRRRTGKDPVLTRDALAALAARNPGNATAWFELAMAQRRLGETAETVEDDEKDEVVLEMPFATRSAEQNAADALAMAAVDRALAADPGHSRANVLKAELLSAGMIEKGDTASASWRAVRDHIVKANAKLKLDPLPLATWFDTFGSQGKVPPKVASDGMALAFSRAPEVAEFRVKYAFDLARQGQYDAALALTNILANDPHRGEMGKAIVAQIKAMRDGAAPVDSSASKSDAKRK